MAWPKKFFEVLCFKMPILLVGLGPLLPSAFSVLKIKMGQKKWRVSRLIIKSEDLISFKSILWETATHQCQLCLLLESIIFLKSYLILWKCNLYNIKCKQTFPENHDLQKRDYHFRMEVVHGNNSPLIQSIRSIEKYGISYQFITWGPSYFLHPQHRIRSSHL